jgi:bacillaene synthase trans-acting acyltransferase
MRSVPLVAGRLPLVCCDRVAMLCELPDGYFWDVVRRPIRFREAIARLEQEEPRRYIDVGPSGTLATMLKHGLGVATRSTVHPILTPFGVVRANVPSLLARVSTAH